MWLERILSSEVTRFGGPLRSKDSPAKFEKHFISSGFLSIQTRSLPTCVSSTKVFDAYAGKEVLSDVPLFKDCSVKFLEATGQDP